MTLLIKTGPIDLQAYISLYHEHTISPESKKIIFIFPGNSSHHGPNINLFSIKHGGGLAYVAKTLGNAGYPCLSLPTTNMENWANDEKIKQLVATALGDLYAAARQGYSFVLPARPFQNVFFSDPLDLTLLQAIDPNLKENLEPSFWGQNNIRVNKPLADYYTQEINRFISFLSLKEEQRQQQEDNPFLKRYLNPSLKEQGQLNSQSLFSPANTNKPNYHSAMAIGMISTAMLILSLVSTQTLILGLALTGLVTALGLAAYTQYQRISHP